MFTKARLALVAVLGLGLAGGIAAAAPGADTQGRGGRRAEVIAKFDTNKDGKLDDTEKAAMKKQFQAKRAEMKAKRLAKYDANKNGKIDDAEKATMQAEHKAERFKKLDTNNDGSISKAEFDAAKPQGRMGHGGHRHGK